MELVGLQTQSPTQSVGAFKTCHFCQSFKELFNHNISESKAGAEHRDGFGRFDFEFKLAIIWTHQPANCFSSLHCEPIRACKLLFE